MKKTLSLILAAVMIAAALLTFASCGKAGSGKVKVIDIALSEEEYAFAVNKSDTELLAKANEYLTKIKGDGTFDAICNKYFGDGVPTKVTSGTLDESKDQLVVATSTGFEPFEMVDESGKFYGIDLEIAAGLAEYLGIDPTVVRLIWAALGLTGTGILLYIIAALVMPENMDIL